MKHATLTLLQDHDVWYVTVTIAGEDHDLGHYTELRDAARRMGTWVKQRGFHWSPGTMAAVEQAHSTDAAVLILHARRIGMSDLDV